MKASHSNSTPTKAKMFMAVQVLPQGKSWQQHIVKARVLWGGARKKKTPNFVFLLERLVRGRRTDQSLDHHTCTTLTDFS